MARYTDAVCKKCRREGIKLFLKGTRCNSNKCSIDRRPFAPGQHGKNRSKLSEYGLQLRAKQRAKNYYRVSESQFRKYYDEAFRREGVTSDILFEQLELRLDNVVYRMGFARTRKEARQIVDHKHVLVNGKCVNIPSYKVSAGDVIEIREKSKSSQRYKDILEVTGGRLVPAWLESNQEALSGTVKEVPTREQIDVPVNETLIVELYSK